MNFHRIDLLAFGPFTNMSLDFSAGQHGLHIIHGPNEAGKSSALRALRQWLFGIPHSSTDNFIHAHQNLRIGGILEGADGQSLEFIRRKGRTKTLRAADDVELIDETRLATMLSGIDESTYVQRFGIDYHELVRGGQAIVAGDGQLGEILFAAGSGVVDLRRVQQRLLDEAEQLFKPRGSVQRINKAIAELAQARKAIKESLLPSSEWVKHHKALDAASARRAEIDELLADRGAQLSRAERHRDAQPLISQRTLLLNELQQVVNAPLLPDDFGELRRESVASLNAEIAAQQEAEQTIESIDATIAKLDIPQALLELDESIESQYQELGGQQKAARDRPGLEARRRQAQEDAVATLRDLGRGPDLAEADGLRIETAGRQRIQELGADYKALIATQQITASKVTELKDQIEQLSQQLTELEAPRDADQLAAAIRRARRLGDLDSLLSEADAELRKTQQQVEIDSEKLPLWDGAPEDIESLPVPSLETIERFDADLSKPANELSSIQQRISDCQQEAQQLDSQIESQRRQQDVPTEEDLTAARQRRDTGWQLVQQSFSDAANERSDDVAAFINESPGAQNLLRAYEAGVERADQIADRLRREADQVAGKLQNLARRDAVGQRLAQLMTQQSELSAECQRIESQWQQLWQPLQIRPLSPREMRTWLARQQALAGLIAASRSQSDRVSQLQQTLAASRDELREHLRRLQEAAGDESGTLAAALSHCEGVASKINEQHEQHRNLTEQVKRLRLELVTAERNATSAGQDVKTWRDQWSAALTQFGYDGETTPAAAIAVLEQVDNLFAKLKEVEDFDRRVSGIDKDAQQFAEAVQQLARSVAPDQTDQPSDEAVATLYRRLSEAKKAQARSQELNEQRIRENDRLKAAESGIRRLNASLQAMCDEAGCKSPDDLPTVEQQSAGRRTIERDLRQAEQQLSRLALGTTLEQFLVDATAVAPDDFPPIIQQLQDEVSALNQERSEIDKTVGSESAELRRMDGSGKAARANEQAAQLVAQIRSDSEQYARLRLASAVLRRGIERFRDRNQGAVLRRAGELFAELTLGSFETIRADYNDKDQAILVGVRPGGQQTVGVNGMSDGTCDQLYLALRLAGLEMHFAEKEPIPFVVDDILINFDDDRAIAALKTLASISDRTQVIFFTHHEHLLHLAEDNLDDDVLVVHKLDARRGSPSTAAATAAS